jgi:hypothetical protein
MTILTSNNTKHPKCIEEERRQLCAQWRAKMFRAWKRVMQRKYAAAAAAIEDECKRTALRAQFDNPYKVLFVAHYEPSVTPATLLIIECLDDVRERAKRARYAKWSAPAHHIEFLPCGILESAPMAPYLERWRRDDAAGPALRARCAYPALD